MVGIHFAWMLGVLVFVGVMAVIVVGLISLAMRTSTGAPRLAPPAQYSADGKWWWDGREWKPVQPPSSLPPTT